MTRHPRSVEQLREFLADGQDCDIAFTCLNLLQPWASLIAINAKQVETRSWSTPYRGMLGIVASAGKGDIGLVQTKPEMRAAFRRSAMDRVVALPSTMPLGALVAFVDLVDVLPTEIFRGAVTMAEESFGDYSDDRYGWKLRNVLRLETPVPMKGQLSLYGRTLSAGTLRIAVKGDR